LTVRGALVQGRRVRPDELWVELAVPASLAADALAACEATLSDEERARAARLRGAGARRAFAVAHALLRAVLSRAVPLPPAAWRFEKGPQGKPALVGAPPEAAPLRFNLSHTEGLVACAVARGAEVGIDAERGARLRDPLAVAERFFAPAEAAALRALGEAERRERFLDAWVLKEALLKGLGLGIAGALREVIVALDAPRPSVVFGPGLGDDPRRWQFELLRPTPEHRLGVAVARGARPDLALRVRFAEELLAAL
jgi:4'-phosphopantetheinyl transferase